MNLFNFFSKTITCWYYSHWYIYGSFWFKNNL